jgi:thiol-disulfide isomerase/thioredoxin
MPSRLRTVPVLLIAAVLTLSACGDAAGPSAGTDEAMTMPTVEATTPVRESLEAPPPVEVPELLDFTAETVDGGTFEGASLAGTDALLWFWAPWCPVCQREAPVVAALAEEYAGRVAVVGVGGLSGDVQAMRDFVERGGVGGLTHLADTDGTIYARFGVTQQYDNGVLDESGEFRVVTGPLSEAEFRAELDALAES